MKFLFLSFVLVFSFFANADGVYIPPEFISDDGEDNGSYIDNFFYKNLLMEKNYNKVTHGDSPNTPRVYLESFTGIPGNYTSFSEFEKKRVETLEGREIKQTCNIGLESNTLFSYLSNKPESFTEDTRACRSVPKNYGDPESPVPMKYDLKCQVIDKTHPEINEMIDDSVNNGCYFFRECESSSHLSILKKCEQIYPKPPEEDDDEEDYEERLAKHEKCLETFSTASGGAFVGGADLNSFRYLGEKCLYQDSCKNSITPMPNSVTSGLDNNILHLFLNSQNNCSNHMNCASGLCLELEFSSSDIASLMNLPGFNFQFGNVKVKQCAPVSACQYNMGHEYYQIPEEGFCANAPRLVKNFEEQNGVIDLENLKKFELKNINGEGGEYFCSYPSLPLEFVGDISAEVDESNCSVDLVETGFKQVGDTIVETVTDKFCVFNRESFVGGIELKTGLSIDQCQSQGGSFFEGHEFVHQRYRMMSRLFNALEYLWGEAKGPALDSDYFEAFKEAPFIMRLFGELRREIEQDRQYYMAKRKLQQAVLEERMKTSKETGDATSLAHDRLMIEYDLEEASLHLRQAQIFGFLLGFFPLNQIRNRAYFNQDKLKNLADTDIKSILSFFDESNPQGVQNKLKLSKEAVVRSSVLPNTTRGTLTYFKRKMFEDDYLSNCNKFGPSFGPEGCKCQNEHHRTICGHQCVPVNYDDPNEPPYYNAMCNSDVKIIKGPDVEEAIYVVDGVYPMNFDCWGQAHQGLDPDSHIILQAEGVQPDQSECE